MYFLKRKPLYGSGVLLHQPAPAKLCEVYVRHWDACKPWQNMFRSLLIICGVLAVVWVVDFQFPCNIHGGGDRSSSSYEDMGLGLQCYLDTIHSHKAFAQYQRKDK